MPELTMELREVTESRREIVGLAAPFDEISYLVPDPRGERLRRGCFARSIDVYAHRKRGGCPLYLNHEHRRALGYSTQPDGLREQPDGLLAVFRVNPGDDGDRLLADLRDGYYPGMSVGFVPTHSTPGKDGVTDITAAELKEVSVVGMGAYAGAGVLTVRTAIALDPILERFKNRPAPDLTPYDQPWLR